VRPTVPSVPPSVEENDGGLKAIIAFKALYGVLLLLIGMGVFALVDKDLADLASQAADTLGVDPDNRYLVLAVEWLTGISARQLAAVGFGTVAYAGLLLTMAWGLHLRQVWAEWLTILATGLFIPVEVYEALRSRRLVYGAVLAINVAIVWYLVRRRASSARAATPLPDKPVRERVPPAPHRR